VLNADGNCRRVLFEKILIMRFKDLKHLPLPLRYSLFQEYNDRSRHVHGAEQLFNLLDLILRIAMTINRIIYVCGA